MSDHHILFGGAGAIGSRCLSILRGNGFAPVIADHQRVERANVGIAAYTSADLGRDKAVVLAERWRSDGTLAYSLIGDVRYTLRPGLARELDGAVLCLDNPTAILDASDALWRAAELEMPVLVLTCGSDAGSLLARLFVRPGTCPTCLFAAAEREDDRLANSYSCADTSAPRASAAAATAAAEKGAELLRRWFEGERSLANLRFQRDAGHGDLLASLPPQPSPRCAVHLQARESRGDRVIDLGGSIARVTVAEMADAALTHAGQDAEIRLGRRIVPLAGLYCRQCRQMAATPPLLLPAARAVWNACTCRAPLRPVGERHVIKARELLEPGLAPLSLAAWGSGHGEEIEAVGRGGRIRLACRFAWSDLDG